MHVRCLIYCRLSQTDEGNEALSLVSQEAALRQRAEREGWRVVGVEVDANLRGWMEESDRPGLASVLRRAAAKDYEVLLVWDLSRLARNVEFQERWIRLLGIDGVEVESHTEPHVRSTPLVRQMLGAVAEHRTREISAASRRSIHQRQQRGLPQGGVPWGYRLGAKDEPLQPVDDPRVHEAIREMFRMRAAGRTLNEICDWLNGEGFRSPRVHGPFTYHTVRKMLRNRAYLGVAANKSATVENAHQPLVDAALWQAAQVPYQYRARSPRGGADTTWLHGLVQHSCGEPMYAMKQDRKNAPRLRCRHYGSCHVKPSQALLRRAEDAVWELVVEAVGTLLPLQAVLREQRRRFREASPASAARRRELEERMARIADRRQRAERLYLDAVRDRGWFDVEDGRLAEEEEAVARQLAALPAPPDEVSLAHLHARVKELKPLLARIPEERRGEVLRELGVAVFDGKGWSLRFHPEWEPLFRAPSPDIA